MKNMIFISLIVMMSSLTFNRLPIFHSRSGFLVEKGNNVPTNCLYGFQSPTLTNIATPIRLNRNYDVECLSLDGVNCVWDKIKNGEDCQKFMTENISNLKPLVCGPAHPGYGVPDHWCEKGRQWFFNTWHCSNESGLPVSIRLDWKTKNVECLSENGKECTTNDDALCRDVNNGKKTCLAANPLRCGKSNVQYFNNANPYYDPKSNWCKLGNEFLFGESQWYCGGDGYGFDTPFRYNSLGDVECFSIDGKECAWGHGTGKECVQYVNTNNKYLRPLVCGEMHAKVKGGDGYSTTNHWCRVLMDKFVLTTRDN